MALVYKVHIQGGTTVKAESEHNRQHLVRQEYEKIDLLAVRGTELVSQQIFISVNKYCSNDCDILILPVHRVWNHQTSLS